MIIETAEKMFYGPTYLNMDAQGRHHFRLASCPRAARHVVEGQRRGFEFVNVSRLHFVDLSCLIIL